MAALEAAIQGCIPDEAVFLDGRVKPGHGVMFGEKAPVALVLQAREKAGTSGQKTRAFSLTSLGSPVVRSVNLPRSSPFK
jgi:hypothetical protein